MPSLVQRRGGSSGRPAFLRVVPPAAPDTSMTEPVPSHRLWTPEGFSAEDEWTHADDAEALAGNGRFILPLNVYSDMSPEARRAAQARIGVVLSPSESVEALEPFLSELALVALAFPAFSDGRSFSKAELLRSRYGYTGALRATGQVLVDQLPHMLRLGFDEFEITNPTLIKRLEEGRVGGLPLAYQPTAEPAAPGETYSWRRVPARCTASATSKAPPVFRFFKPGEQVTKGSG